VPGYLVCRCPSGSVLGRVSSGSESAPSPHDLAPKRGCGPRRKDGGWPWLRDSLIRTEAEENMVQPSHGGLASNCCRERKFHFLYVQGKPTYTPFGWREAPVCDYHCHVPALLHLVVFDAAISSTPIPQIRREPGGVDREVPTAKEGDRYRPMCNGRQKEPASRRHQYRKQSQILSRSDQPSLSSFVIIIRESQTINAIIVFRCLISSEVPRSLTLLETHGQVTQPRPSGL
jgi:hypothetical protein